MEEKIVLEKKNEGISAKEAEKLRFATDDELNVLRQGLIDVQPDDFKFPDINPDLKFSYTQVNSFLQIRDAYVKAYYDFWEEIEKRVKAI